MVAGKLMAHMKKNQSKQRLSASTSVIRNIKSAYSTRAEQP
ncbi:hypothetical protein [Rubritalea tangerina]